MARPSKPGPQLVGIRAHQKRDLFEGCNEPGKPWFTPNPAEFQKGFCRICRNEECIRAQGAITPWHHRMEHQVDYLLNNPKFSDLSTEDHKHLAAQMFRDLTQKAERLEIARIRQDWEIPGEPEGPTDGVERVVTAQATEKFNDAVKALSKSKVKSPESSTETETATEAPSHFTSQTESPPSQIEYSTQFPSSDGKRNYSIVLTREGYWSCACAGFKNVKHCKHLDQVVPWYEQHKNDDAQPEPTPVQSAPTPVQSAAPQPKASPPSNLNTPVPQQGIMLGGGSAPTPKRSQLPPDPVDPWTPRKDHVVQPGATVVMKSKK